MTPDPVPTEWLLERAGTVVTITEADGVITYVSPSVDRILGYDQRALVGENAFARVHPEDVGVLRHRVEAALEGQRSIKQAEYRFETADGEWCWLRSIGVDPLNSTDTGDVLISTIDITETKGHSIRQESALESVNDGIVVIEEGTVTYANRRLLELGGYHEREVVGEPFASFVAEEDRDRVAVRYERRTTGEPTADTYKIKLRTRQGATIPVELSVSTVDGDAVDPAVIAIVRDIRDRVAREQQLQVLERLLRHNMRNALTTVRGEAEAIARGLGDPADATDRIIQRVDDLLRMADKEREAVDLLLNRPDRTPTDVPAACRNAVNSVVTAYPGADVTLNTTKGAVALATDDLDRAVRELIENAVVHADEVGSAVSVAVHTDRDTVTIEIVDNGPSIPSVESEVLTAVREPDQLAHTSGIGLWLVNWVVEQSGGILDFERRSPRGNIVTIQLERVR